MSRVTQTTRKALASNAPRNIKWLVLVLCAAFFFPLKFANQKHFIRRSICVLDLLKPDPEPPLDVTDV